MNPPEAVRPRRLRPGDLVALVSPSGPLTPEQAAPAAQVLARWGLRARHGRHALGRHTFLSGTDDERLTDLDAAFRDPEVRGILCLRGGYGTQRIVDRIDYDAVRADPKLVIGFSDITALHLALWCEARLATVHGPVGAGLYEISAPAEETLRRTVMTGDPVIVTPEEDGVRFPGRASGTGRADGILLGGNLTLLAASAGTPHRPDTTGAILLIEEVGEAAYRVDRSIVQLRRAGWFDGLAGVAVGRFTRCPGADQVLAEHLGALGVPVLGGLPIGHGGEQTAVPLGVAARLDAGAGTLTVQPAAR
ncbi:LD-carboxypeptidase [Actinoplanes sp. NEAU-A12]|uniref:LD-carboxypeptidase n=1 Tax=Actinoplanes sandaracinus TaxID=3045177 RepID=A0ABT6WRR6_9ACTN|nr:LD-carboxypeptidase [Actinoplanes sandaracinus]MDI6102432.1 LD-carboxypeptidase [Actinoplanes sandaracinus]